MAKHSDGRLGGLARAGGRAGDLLVVLGVLLWGGTGGLLGCPEPVLQLSEGTQRALPWACDRDPAADLPGLGCPQPGCGLHRGFSELPPGAGFRGWGRASPRPVCWLAGLCPLSGPCAPGTAVPPAGGAGDSSSRATPLACPAAPTPSSCCSARRPSAARSWSSPTQWPRRWTGCAPGRRPSSTAGEGLRGGPRVAPGSCLLGPRGGCTGAGGGGGAAAPGPLGRGSPSAPSSASGSR